MRSVGEAANHIASTLMPVADVKTVPLAQADYHCDLRPEFRPLHQMPD